MDQLPLNMYYNTSLRNVGLYTSPHLLSFQERIRVNGTSIKIKEGKTVKVGTLLGFINEETSSSITTAKTDAPDQNQKSYIPPKVNKKKNIAKETFKKKIISEEQKPLNLVNESKEINSHEALILDTLAEDDLNETKKVLKNM